MADLSPQAQAVMDASLAVNTASPPPARHRECLAAALRAAADQVAPSDDAEPRNYLPFALENTRIRNELLAIATELENANDWPQQPHPAA
jgi:hypothetical protein